MKPETKRAIEAALETPAFEKVRAALMAEAKFAETACEEHRSRRHLSGLSSAVSAKDWWDNDRWQAAWREMCASGLQAGQIGLDVFYEAYVNDECGFYVAPPHEQMLTGDELADALRDWVLERGSDVN